MWVGGGGPGAKLCTVIFMSPQLKLSWSWDVTIIKMERQNLGQHIPGYLIRLSFGMSIWGLLFRRGVGGSRQLNNSYKFQERLFDFGKKTRLQIRLTVNKPTLTGSLCGWEEEGQEQNCAQSFSCHPN